MQPARRTKPRRTSSGKPPQPCLSEAAPARPGRRADGPRPARNDRGLPPARAEDRAKARKHASEGRQGAGGLPVGGGADTRWRTRSRWRRARTGRQEPWEESPAAWPQRSEITVDCSTWPRPSRRFRCRRSRRNRSALTPALALKLCGLLPQRAGRRGPSPGLSERRRLPRRAGEGPTLLCKSERCGDPCSGRAARP